MIEFKNKFIEDALELLFKLEQTVLDLEKNTSNSALIEEVFRTMHTLKGTSGMYGFTEMGTLTHRLETIFDLIRNGRIMVEDKILNLTFETIDFLNKVLKTDDKEPLDYQPLYQKIENILQLAGEEIERNQEVVEKIPVTFGMQTWFITITPFDDLRERGIKMHLIFDELTQMGKNHIFNRNLKDANTSGLFWEIILATEQSQSDIEDAVIFIEDITVINHLAEGDLFENALFLEKIDDFSKSNSIDFDELKTFVDSIFENEKKSSNSDVIDNQHIETIKVPAARLDEQMNLLSELVTTKAEMQLLVQKYGYEHLLKPLEQLEKITRRFRKNIFKIRLMPLETLHLRFDRLIRDISNLLHKKVNFVCEGLHTELDKTIIDSLESPLMHLIRNSLDHGIEAEDIRKMRGKNGLGTIKLTARQAAAYVHITVSDDGEGLNFTKIKEKAISKGIIDKNEKIADDQLKNMIFYSGFSTAQTLTEVSGRGVGMDVVKQTINNLHGSIEVFSEKGKGVRFEIKLPLSLSIIDTMLVRVEQMFYAIPISSIDKCTEIELSQLKQFDNKHLIINTQLIPYLILKDFLRIENNVENNVENKTENKPENLKSKVVIVKNENEKTALLVDEVIGEHQAVLKPIGEYFISQPYISGASQLASGHIALVLDTSRFNLKTNIHSIII